MVADVVQTWATRPPFAGLTRAEPPDRCHPVQATAQKGCYKRSRHTSAVTPRAFTGNRVDYTDPAAPSKGATFRPTAGDGAVTVAYPGDQWHTVWDHSHGTVPRGRRGSIDARRRIVRMGNDVVDVVVVGTGNAAFCAAHAARDHGARVLMLEKGPEDWVGGNSYFTAGAFRIAFDSQDDLVALLADPSDERLPRTDVPPYPASAFLADMERLTLGRTDPVLAKILVEDSLDTARWLRDHGIRFHLQYHRQAYEVNGRFRFWGDL